MNNFWISNMWKFAFFCKKTGNFFFIFSRVLKIAVAYFILISVHERTWYYGFGSLGNYFTDITKTRFPQMFIIFYLDSGFLYDILRISFLPSLTFWFLNYIIDLLFFVFVPCICISILWNRETLSLIFGHIDKRGVFAISQRWILTKICLKYNIFRN